MIWGCIYDAQKPLSAACVYIHRSVPETEVMWYVFRGMQSTHSQRGGALICSHLICGNVDTSVHALQLSGYTVQCVLLQAFATKWMHKFSARQIPSVGEFVPRWRTHVGTQNCPHCTHCRRGLSMCNSQSVLALVRSLFVPPYLQSVIASCMNGIAKSLRKRGERSLHVCGFTAWALVFVSTAVQFHFCHVQNVSDYHCNKVCLFPISVCRGTV